MADRGINRQSIDRFQLGVTGDGRLAIPYLTPVGAWHIKTRCIDPDHHDADGHNVKWCPKYKNTHDAEQHLYNTGTLLRADRVVVVEGELDAISVEQTGIPAVGFPGAETWVKNHHWKWCFDSVDSIVVVADGDDPEKNPKQNGLGVGEQAGRLVADTLRKALLHVDVELVVLPVGHDSNSYIGEFGPLEYLEQIGMI